MLLSGYQVQIKQCYAIHIKENKCNPGSNLYPFLISRNNLSNNRNKSQFFGHLFLGAQIGKWSIISSGFSPTVSPKYCIRVVCKESNDG